MLAVGIGISPVLDRRIGGSTPPVTPGLRLTFDGTFPVADPSSVSDWNTFFTLPTNGTPFTSVQVNGNEVNLIGGSGITAKINLFFNNTHLTKIEDEVACIYRAAASSFRNCTSLTKAHLNGLDTLVNTLQFSGDTLLDDVYFPLLTTTATSMFASCGFTVINDAKFPLLSSVGVTAFSSNLSLTSVTLSNVTTIGNNGFNGCTALAAIEFTLCTTLGQRVFLGSIIEEITDTELPALTTIIGGFTTSSFYGMPSLLLINLSTITSIGAYCLYALDTVEEITLPNVTSVDEGGIALCPLLNDLNIPSCLTIGNGSLLDNASLIEVNLPLCTSIGGGAMENCMALTTINIPACTDLGGSVFDDGVFNTISGNTITLTVPTALMTADSGNPDGDIVALQTNNTVTVITV